MVAAMLALLVGCVRPQGTKALANIQPSPSPVAARPPLTIANPVFHSGEVGVTYPPVTLSATGGLPPYTWMVVGALPGGLTLSSDGIVSGTPTQNGYFAFSVQVLDFGNNDTAGVPATIPIVPRLTASLVSGCATECTVELGCVSVCGNFGQVSGGAAPLTYTLTSGPLPAGTTLNGLSLNGTFKGLPGRLQFTVQVTDGFGATATIAPRYNLIPHISFAGGAIGGQPNDICSWNGCSRTFPYSGGSGAVTARAIGWQYPQSCSIYPPPNQCPAPPQPTVSASGGVVTINVPWAGRNWGGGYQGAILTVQLNDQNLCGAGSYCSAVGNVSVTVQTS